MARAKRAQKKAEETPSAEQDKVQGEVEVRWYKDARSRIAPRTVQDLALVRYNWAHKDWGEIRKALEGLKALRTNETDLGEPLQSVLGWAAMDKPPKTASDLELDVALAITQITRSAPVFVEHFGAARVAPFLAGPTLESKWMPSESSYFLARSKRGPEFRTLRSTLIRENEESRAKCREAVQRFWDEGEAAVHEALAFAFFEVEEWREIALKEILTRDVPFASEQITHVRDAETMRVLLDRAPKNGQKIQHAEIVASLGADALEILLERAPNVRGAEPHRSHTYAMSVLVCEQTAKHFAERISNPASRKVITDFFTRCTALGKLVLPAASEGASRNAALAKELLVKIGGKIAEPEDVVGLDDPAIPEVLRDPPWEKLPPLLPELGLSIDAYPENIVVPAASREEAEKYFKSMRVQPEMTAEETEAYVKSIGTNSVYQLVYENKSVPMETVIDLYAKGQFSAWGSYHNYYLAYGGNKALPRISRDVSNMLGISDALRNGIDSPRLAWPLGQKIFAALRSGEAESWSWFRAQPRAAAYGLLANIHVPDMGRVVEALLRRLARTHRDVILEVAKSTKHSKDIEALLDRDARWDLYVKPAKERVPGVTRPRLLDGRALGDDVIARIIEMISAAPVDETYIGIEEVKAACDPKSLSEMSWDLAALADGSGRAARQRSYSDSLRWTLVHFADDTVIRRLTPALKHQSIYRVLEVLAARESRSAAIEIATAVDREDPNATRTIDSLSRVAKMKGVSRDEIVETMLPTTELSADGSRELSYGSRKLRVGFDTTLAPILFDGDKRLASLPRAKKNDDEVAVRLAKETWDELKEDVRTIARFRCRAIEQWMREREEISKERFLSGWAHHPLGKHLARGIVWAAVRGGTIVPFRVAEDSSLADLEDRALVLADGETVRVPHPLDLGKEAVERWTQTFVDYDLIQPISQLGRSALVLPPEEENAISIARPITIPLATYERIVVDQGFAQNGYYGHKRESPKANVAVLLTREDEWVARKRRAKKVTLEIARGTEKLAMNAVDPVERSEALFTLRLILEAC